VTSKIEISVISAAKLTGVDLNGLSDPYVKVKVFRTNAEIDKKHKFKTEVISKTLSPVWNAK
jgi:Ca2+-dependent lipid-binding protein